MRRFTTLTQWRILKYFWKKQDTFTLDELLGEGIIHHPALGRLTLQIMEARGQVLSRHTTANKREYIATTDSKDEWKRIWVRRPSVPWIVVDSGLNMRGVNKYEHAKTLAELDKIIEDFAKGIEAEKE